MTRSINAGRSDETPLMNFTEYHTFQGFYKVTPSDKTQTPEYAFNRCILHITSWLKKRIKLNKHYDSSEVQFLYDYPEPDSLLTEGFDVFADEDLHLKRAKKQFDISIFAIKEFGEWTIRIREPNNQSEKAYLDWLFTTDIALKISGDLVYLAVRTKCKESHSHGKKASPFRTKCLPYIFEDESLIVSEGNIASHNYQVNMQKLSINRTGNRKKDEYEFIKIIKDPNRQMPVVFCPALFNEEDEKNGFRITKLSEHLSGTAYVVTDEMCNGYKELFKERMAEFLKEIGIKPADALTLITAGYLCIDPISDGAKAQWFMIDPSISEFETKDKLCEKAIEKEIGQIEDYVKERMLNMDSDIAYGETLFYSALWDEYINKTDSKLIEDLNSQLGEAQQKLSEVIANHEENDEQKLQEVMAELTEKLKADFEKDKKVKAAQFESRLEGKDLKISELKNKNETLEKRVKELEALLPKELARKKAEEITVQVENYLSQITELPSKKEDVLEWIDNNFSDNIFVHTDARNSYKKYMDLGFHLDRFCNGFILLNAYTLNVKGEMSNEVYNKINEKWGNIRIEDSGYDYESTQKIPAARIGDRVLDKHVVHGSNDKEMFRIYFYYDENNKKTVVGSMPDHLYYPGGNFGYDPRKNKV